MEQKAQASKITNTFIAIYLTCCVCMCICIMGLIGTPVLFSDSSPYALFPTSTLDPACSDYACLQKCMQRLPNMIAGNTFQHLEAEPDQDDVIELVRYKISEDGKSIQRIATPTVPDNLKSYQMDEALHQRIWQYYADIFPNIKPLNIAYLIIYTDGDDGNSAASVRELDNLWRLSIDILDFKNQYATTETLIHEFGHVLTINHLQIKEPEWVYTKQRVGEVDWDQTRQTCKTFFSGSSCAFHDSYLNQFGQRFWQGMVYDDWFAAYKTGWAGRRTIAFDLYQKYPGYFVSTYAATNPVEDLAETWTKFIFESKPRGKSISEQKILFFYEYPALVQNRAEIIQGICQYAAGLAGK